MSFSHIPALTGKNLRARPRDRRKRLKKFPQNVIEPALMRKGNFSPGPMHCGPFPVADNASRSAKRMVSRMTPDNRFGLFDGANDRCLNLG